MLKSIQKRLESHEYYHREEISNSNEILEDLTLREFRDTIKGKRLWVNIQGAPEDFEIRIAQMEAVELYKHVSGEIQIFPFGGKELKLEV